MKSIGAILICSACLVAVYLLGDSILHGLTADKWPTVVGRIVRIDKHHIGSVTSEDVYLPEVTYTYHIDGHDVTSNRLSAEPEAITEFLAHCQADHSPLQSRCTRRSGDQDRGQHTGLGGSRSVRGRSCPGASQPDSKNGPTGGGLIPHFVISKTGFSAFFCS